MAQHLKVSLRGGKQERKKKQRKEREKKKQSSNYFFVTFADNKAPLHITPQNAILERNFRYLLWLQRYYSVLSIKAQKRYSPQYLYYKEILISSASAIYEFLDAKQSCKTTNSSNSVTGLCMQYIRMQHIRVSSYWPNMKQAVHNKAGYSKYCYMNTHREIIHCSAYTSLNPIIPYFRVLD